MSCVRLCIFFSLGLMPDQGTHTFLGYPIYLLENTVMTLAQLSSFRTTQTKWKKTHNSCSRDLLRMLFENSWVQLELCESRINGCSPSPPSPSRLGFHHLAVPNARAEIFREFFCLYHYQHFFSPFFFFFPFLPFQSHNGSKPLWIKFSCVFNVIWNLPIVLSPPGCRSLLKPFPLWPEDFLGLIWIFQPQEGRASGTRCPPGLWWALWQRMSPKSWAFHLCTLDLVLTHTQSHS